MMKLVLVLTALIAVAQPAPQGPAPMGEQAGPMGPPPMGMGPPPMGMGPPPMGMGPPPMGMGPAPMEMEMMAEEMMAEEMMAEAAMEFCADVAKGEEEAAMKFVDEALAFQCGEQGTKAGCDDLTKDKEAGLAVVAEKLGCKSSEKSAEAPSE